MRYQSGVPRREATGNVLDIVAPVEALQATAILSPTLKATLRKVLLQLNEVSVIEQVNVVFRLFFAKVTLKYCPLPGAVLTRAYNLSMVMPMGIVLATCSSVPMFVAP